jgi:hypothetical protein
LARTIETIDYGDFKEVKVTDGNTVTMIRVDEENEAYQAIKAETNNFTENMNKPSQAEEVATTQSDLIYQLMMNGVI